ncbi:MAG TPA: hypothetical protein VE821_08885 [Pyrinomonadaceae bacterium]|nr:hypothetical protein [Pyrinomonadaceae bacterium]
MVIAQADDEAAWGKPVRVRRTEGTDFSLSAELVARAAFFARLHQAANVEAWLERIVQERLDLEEAVLAELKRDLVTK